MPNQKNKPTKKQIEKFKKQGQYPRVTKNWLRYRQQGPSKFSKFRIKKISSTHQLVVGKLKKTGRWILQSILKKKKVKKLNRNLYKL